MLYLSILTIVVLYIYLYKTQKEVFQYIPVTKSRVINLYGLLNNDDPRQLYKLIVNIVMLVGFVIIMAVSLKLNVLFTVTIIIIIITLLPIIIIWNLNYTLNLFELNNLNTYLNQFILVFKNDGNILFTLKEIENSLEGRLNTLIHQAIDKIEHGESSMHALNVISDAFPHFIVFNLHTLVYGIEQFGTLDYFDALDLIQDDIDDWLDDTLNNNLNKMNIIRKVSFLIVFAFVICFLALNMLFTVSIDIENNLYQVAIFVFCLFQIITYVLVSTLLNQKMLDKSETL